MRLQILVKLIFFVIIFSFGSLGSVMGESDPIELSSSTFRINFPEVTCLDAHMIRIPFQLVNRLIVIDVQIENTVGKLILDTGAEKLFLNIQYFNKAELQPSYSLAGLIGEKEAVFQKKIEEFFLDQFLFPEHEIRLMDLSHIERKRKVILLGILGYEVLKDFEILIDYDSRTIIFTKVNNKGVPFVSLNKEMPILDSMKFLLFKHLIIVRPLINGARLLMALDTGSEYNLLDRRVRKKVLAQFESGTPLHLTDISNKEEEVPSGMLGGLSCGPYKNLVMRTILINMQLVWKNVGIKIDGIMGYEFLKDKKVVINYKKRKLYFLHGE